MSELNKPEFKYNDEFKTAVEKRQERGLLTVETKTIGDKEVLILNIAGIRVESKATNKEDIESIFNELYQSPDDIRLLKMMATSYLQGRGLIVEDKTGTGKTFLMDKFTEMMFGKGCKPINFYTNGQTDTMSLMAKYVPDTDDPGEKAKWNAYTKSVEYKEALSGILENARNGAISTPEVIRQMEELPVSAGINSTGWKFQYGALPRAMTLLEDPEKPHDEETNPARGMFFHVQEVGLAETHVIDALLQLGGHRGQIAKEINLWEDKGRTVKAGSEFWVYYSTNPPEKYPDRHALDEALVRRNTFYRREDASPATKDMKSIIIAGLPLSDPDFPEDIKTKMDNESRDLVFPVEGEELFDYDDRKYNKVKILVGRIMNDFTEKLSTMMDQKKVESRVKQRFVLTDDEQYMVTDFIRRFKTKDFEATIDSAVYTHYVARFTDEGKKNAWDLWEEIKTQTKFKDNLVEALPQEQSNSMVEFKELQALREFSEEMDKQINELDEEVGQYCELNPDEEAQPEPAN